MFTANTWKLKDIYVNFTHLKVQSPLKLEADRNLRSIQQMLLRFFHHNMYETIILYSIDGKSRQIFNPSTFFL